MLERPGGTNIEFHGLAFLTGTLGAAVFCDAFNGVTDDPDCDPVNTSYCLRWMPAGGPFPTVTDIDAYGSYCPNLYGFNVYTTNGGMGNRYYSAEDGLKEMVYAQVCNEDLGGDTNYRTVLDGVSWHHMTRRDGNALEPEDLCPRDTPSIIDGALSEIGAALRWGFGVVDNADIPKLVSAEALTDCQGTGQYPNDVRDGPLVIRVNRLYPNEPNPFNPTTRIRFSLAQRGRAKIVIYDLVGRTIKTLVDAPIEAGHHSVTWDGRNESGQRVSSGVYWMQMQTDTYSSKKKMVALK
jgi:hypothetical protein